LCAKITPHPALGEIVESTTALTPSVTCWRDGLRHFNSGELFWIPPDRRRAIVTKSPAAAAEQDSRRWRGRCRLKKSRLGLGAGIGTITTPRGRKSRERKCPLVSETKRKSERLFLNWPDQSRQVAHVIVNCRDSGLDCRRFSTEVLDLLIKIPARNNMFGALQMYNAELKAVTQSLKSCRWALAMYLKSGLPRMLETGNRTFFCKETARIPEVSRLNFLNIAFKRFQTPGRQTTKSAVLSCCKDRMPATSDLDVAHLFEKTL